MSPSSVLVLNKRLDHKLSTNHYILYNQFTINSSVYTLHDSRKSCIHYRLWPYRTHQAGNNVKRPPLFIDKRCTSVIWTKFHLNEPLFARTKAF